MKKGFSLILALLIVFGSFSAAFAEEAEKPEAAQSAAVSLLMRFVDLSSDVINVSRASSRDAQMAYELLRAISIKDLMQLDLSTVSDILQMTIAVLKPSSREEAIDRLQNIIGIINTAFINYNLVRSLFTAAGLEDEMNELIGKSNVSLNWMIFRTGYQLLNQNTSGDTLEKAMESAAGLLGHLIDKRREQKAAAPETEEITGGVDVLKDLSLYDVGYIVKNIIHLAVDNAGEATQGGE